MLDNMTMVRFHLQNGQRARESEREREENKSRASFTANVQPADTGRGREARRTAAHTNTLHRRRSAFLPDAKHYFTDKDSLRRVNVTSYREKYTVLLL